MKQSTRKNPKSSPHKNLCRCQSPSFTGVRLAVQRNGLGFVRYYALKDSDWETVEQAALAERDRLVAKIDGLNEAQLMKFFKEYRNGRNINL